jgi:hypothetical protein
VNAAMKSVISLIALVSLASIATGCEDKRTANLEKRVAQLEEKTKQLETEMTKATDERAQRELDLRNCVADANAEYRQDIASNGTKTSRGTYSLPVTAMDALDKQKRNKIEECKLLYH